MFGTKTKTAPLLMTTTETLDRPFDILGVVFSYAAFNQPAALKALEKQARKMYPQLDAVVGVKPQTNGIGITYVGTAVRYREE